MRPVKTRMREKVIVSVAIVVLATGSFMFAEKYVKDHAHQRYPNVVASAMDSMDYYNLCNTMDTEISKGIVSLGTGVLIRNTTMNHDELSANALALKDEVGQDITRMDNIKPPTDYTSDYMGFVGQLTAIQSALQTFSNDAQANDVAALQKDKTYLISLSAALAQYIPAIQN